MHFSVQKGHGATISSFWAILLSILWKCVAIVSNCLSWTQKEVLKPKLKTYHWQKSIGDIFKDGRFHPCGKKPVNAAFCRTRMSIDVIRLGNYMCIILHVTSLMASIWLWIKCYWFRSNLMKSPKVSQYLMSVHMDYKYLKQQSCKI